MPLPQRLKNAMHNGEDQAVRLPDPRPGWRAWVWVRPWMKSGKTYAQVRAEWSLRRVTPQRYDPTVESYTVRYLELSEWHIAQDLEIDRAMAHQPVEDIQIEVKDEAELEQVLSRWVPDLSHFRSPRAVRYPNPPLKY
jgi:hypothetical protein